MSVDAREVLTIVFLGVGGYCLLRCVLAGSAPSGHRHVHLLSDLAHLGMSVGMVAMLWRPVGDRWGAQLAFFAIGCGWFLVRALKSAAGAARPALLHQAVAMAAMFWMLSRTAVGGQPHSTLASMGTASMGAGLSGVARPGAAATATTLAFAVYLSGAALWWLRVSHRAPGWSDRGPVSVVVGGWQHGRALSVLVFGAAGDAVCQAVMAAATVAVLIVMM